MKRYMESGSAGKVLGVSAQYVLDLVREGRLSVAAQTTRGTRLFAPEDIERLAQERQAKANAK